MAKNSTFVLSTITPVRTPVNVSSETLAFDLKANNLTLPLRGQPFDGAFSHQFKVDDIEWRDGYVDLNHDAIPPTFRPLLKRRIPIEDRDKSFADLKQLKADTGLVILRAELYFFDSTVGLMRLDFGLENEQASVDLTTIATSQTDKLVTRIACVVYEKIVCPELARNGDLPLDDWIRGQKTGRRSIEPFAPPKFTSGYNSDWVFWTGRCLIVEHSSVTPEQKKQLLSWASCLQEELFKNGDDNVFIGSGNCLVLSANDEPEEVATTFFRAAALCQIYYAFLKMYEDTFCSALHRMADTEKVRLKDWRKLKALISETGRQLELLTFLKLEFQAVVRGVQGKRKALVEHFVSSWKMPELEGAALERAGFIRERLVRIREERRSAQARAIELMLSLIGGIAVIDLALSLTEASKDLPDDSIPGILDLFALVPADTSLYVALIIVIAFAAYTYFAKK